MQENEESVTVCAALLTQGPLLESISLQLTFNDGRGESFSLCVSITVHLVYIELVSVYTRQIICIFAADEN